MLINYNVIKKEPNITEKVICSRKQIVWKTRISFLNISIYLQP